MLGLLAFGRHRFGHIIENLKTSCYDIHVGLRALQAAAVALAGLIAFPATASARVNYRRLLKDLPQASAGEKPLMIRAIGRSKRKRAMRALLPLFEREDTPPDEKRVLALALGDLGYAHSVPALVRAWDSLLTAGLTAGADSGESAEFRAAVVRAIGRSAKPGDVRALSVVRRGLADPQAGVALAAIAAAGRMRDEASVDALSVHLERGDRGRSRAAAEALAGIGGERVARLLRARLDSAEGPGRVDAAYALALIGRRIGTLTLDGFLEEVEGPYAEGIAAARDLAALGRTNGLAYLVSIVRDRESGFFAAAVEALGDSGSPRAILPLAEVLESEDPAVRALAIEALGRIGGDRAAFELRRRRNDSDPVLRVRIREVRAELGDYALP
jgi:HEAT repeat protein